MSVAFSNMPKKYDLKDYDDVLILLEEKYSSQDLVAIYDWGTPANPGISDLDVLFVWKPYSKPLPFSKRSFAILGQKERYIIRHPFMHVSEQGFSNLPYVYPNGNMRKMCGKELKLNQLKKVDKKNISRAVLNDIIVRHYPRDFIRQVVDKRINVRDSLLRLNSLKYTFSTMRDTGMRLPLAWPKFIEEVRRLRENWFECPDKEKLVELIEKAMEIAMNIIELGSKFPGKMYPDIIEKMPEKMDYCGIKNGTQFIKNWDKEKALKEMESQIAKGGKYPSILPMEYAAQLYFYAQQEGLISLYIRSNLTKIPSLKIDENDALKKRICVLNNQAELASKLRHSDFPAFFDFGYRNKSGVNNMLLRLSDKLRY